MPRYPFPISGKNPEVGTDAWAIGFPDTFLSSGIAAQKQVLKAKIFQGFTDLKASRGETVIYPEESWFDSSRLFLLAGKVLAGMSGGAVLNQDGQIIGILIATSRSGDAIVLKASFVSAELKKKFGEKEFAENFSSGIAALQ